MSLHGSPGSICTALPSRSIWLVSGDKCTIRMKAEFPNTNLQLWPGQFINVRLLVDTLKQVVVIPTAAVPRGPQGTFVYVVEADNKVAVRPVTVAQQDDTRAVISDGLKAQEQVVTTGASGLAHRA